MLLRKSLGRALIFSALLLHNPCQALTIWAGNGALHLSGEANAADVEKLQTQLTPEIKTVLLLGSIKGNWTVARDLAHIINKANVDTALRGECAGFVCPMIFLSGKTRMFSTAFRDAANNIRLSFSDEAQIGGAEGDDRSWREAIDWWRAHTKLARADFTLRNKPIFSANNTAPAEALVYFHPDTRTSKGNSWECSGTIQTLRTCSPNQRAGDALTMGIITTKTRYESSNAKPVRDIAAPSASGFAELTDTQLKVTQLNDACREAYQTFLTYDAPRAFVVNTIGGCYYRHAQTSTPYKFALEACRQSVANFPGNAQCRFYAIDNNVVFTPFEQAEPAPSTP